MILWKGEIYELAKQIIMAWTSNSTILGHLPLGGKPAKLDLPLHFTYSSR
jgi:hypothetical protein